MRKMIGRLTRAADFERLLSSPVRRRSAHFALHYLRARPTAAVAARRRAQEGKLSTMCEPTCPELVEEPPRKIWLGCLLPKRHARRAVTRSTLERQIRAAAARHEGEMPGGLWLVRLRQAFAPAAFRSADSSALREAARSELELLFATEARVPRIVAGVQGR